MLDLENMQQHTNKVPDARYLDVLGISKTYGDLPVVCDVNFSLERGKFLSLLGPSGSGKTTTLMMVAGFVLPTRGEIWVDGSNIASIPARHRNLGVVFQGYALFPHMSVLDNVMFPLRMRKIPWKQRSRAAIEMLEKVGLSEFANRRPRELSGGQQQRVALARALVFEPDVLLLDEPLGALDKNLRESLQIEIMDIQRRTGITVLFVTHDQEEAMMMSDYIVVMKDGCIAQHGTPPDVYLRPQSSFVARFLGETNLINCTNRGVELKTSIVQLADGSVARAQRHEDLETKVGSQVTMSIRPERLRILDDNMPAQTRIEGVILERTFLGRHIRYVVQALGQSLVVSTTRLDLMNRVQVGDDVVIGWDSEEAQLLAGE